MSYQHGFYGAINGYMISQDGLMEERMKDRRLKVNRVDLQIRDYKNQADPIIFLHFSGSNLMMWQRTIPYFKDRYRLILVDLRGHGKSDRPENGYHMDEMAKDVIGVMEHLELEGAHIIGSSIGAEVGLSMAANYPEKVLTLVLDGALSNEYGPYGTWDGTKQAFEAYVAEQLEKIGNAPDAIYASMDELIDDRRALFEKYGWWNEYLETMVRYDAWQTEDGKYARGMGKTANLNYMRDYYQYRFEDYYSKVNCPLLMLAEKDSEDAREKAAMLGLKGLAKQAEIVEIKDWAHPYMWFLEPKGAIDAILKFLDRVAQDKPA
jgi:2-succinyl-6-hydroxy-2,4-cyclohexadiene-1-carboxylate synthase